MYSSGKGVIILLMLLLSMNNHAQTVGIGTDYPSATLDVRTTVPRITLNLDRELAAPSGDLPALRLQDDSDWSAAELSQLNVLNTSSVSHIVHDGLGDGIHIELTNPLSGQDGIQVWTFGDYQNAVFNNLLGTASWGILNLVDAYGVGMYNGMTDDGGVSVYTDMENQDGTGYFFSNIDLSVYPGTISGSGDGFAFDAYMNTTTASIGTTTFGAIVGGEQHGVGHGILINHEGTQGRNAEFNINNSSNSSPVIFSTSSGQGEVIRAQHNGTKSTGGTFDVASFTYAGTQSRNHRAVYAYSAPASGSGYGGDFTGGNYGVVGRGATGATSGVHAVGNVSATGAKPFMIDHPLDPENRVLRHFAIESNEVLNMYRGVTTLNEQGRATVVLPDYFEAINRNFSYHLTAIGTPKQPWIKREIEQGKFVIAGKPGTKVSWTVYANRNDAFVKSNPDLVTSQYKKKPDELGRYLDPASHGKPEHMSIHYVDRTSAEPMEQRVVNTSQLGALQDRGQNVNTSKEARIPSGRDSGAGQTMEIRQEVRTWDELED